MKVAIITTDVYSPISGGALANWTYQVYNLLKLDCLVIARSESSQSGNYRSPPLKSCQEKQFLEVTYDLLRNRSVGGLLRPIKRWLNNSFGRSSARIAASFQADIIHIHNAPDFVLPARRLNPKAKIILHMNNDHLVDGLIGDHTLMSLEKLCNSTDRIAFCSEFIRQNALKQVPALDKSKTFLIANGASNLFAPSTALKTFRDDPCLLFVGRIVPYKGVHILLDALKYILSFYPNASLRIVGGVNFGSHEEDEYLTSVKKEAKLLENHVTFLGPVPHDQVVSEFQKAHLFVCPSIWNDPLPTVNAEAMACGLPIVAFAKGGIPEIVGDAGILVEETTPEALAQAINQVLGDSELYQTLSQRGLQRVKETFNWDAIAQTWLNELQKLSNDK